MNRQIERALVEQHLALRCDQRVVFAAHLARFTTDPLFEGWPGGHGARVVTSTAPPCSCGRPSALLYADGTPRCLGCGIEHVFSTFTSCRLGPGHPAYRRRLKRLAA